MLLHKIAIRAKHASNLVDAIVPENSLEDIVRAQAMKSAKSILQEVHHHMKLEKQKVNPEIYDQQSELIVQFLNRENLRSKRISPSVALKNSLTSGRPLKLQIALIQIKRNTAISIGLMTIGHSS